MAKSTKFYLVIDMRTGEPKIFRRKPETRFASAVYELNINLSEKWQKPLGTIDLTLPEPDEDMVQVMDALDLLEETGA